MGFKTFLNEEINLKLYTISLPNNIEFEKLHDYLYNYGLTIYPVNLTRLVFVLLILET